MSENFKEAFEKTKIAGSIAAGALDEVSKIVKPGISTNEIDKTCYEAIIPYLFEWDSLLDLQPILNDTRFDKNKVTESGDSWLYLAMIDSLWRCNREAALFGDNDGLSLFIKYKKNEYLLQLI